MAIIAGSAWSGPTRHQIEGHADRAIARQKRFCSGDGIRVFAAPGAVLAIDQDRPSIPNGQDDPGVLIVADWRLDNREEITGALALTESRSLSDEEILRLAWLRWGIGCLQKVVGPFAIVVHDPSSRRTFLARDAFGERPLNFAVEDGVLRFASMPSGVWPDRRLRPALPVLADYFRGRPSPPDQSDFERIVRVAPATVVTFENGTISARRYWNPERQALPKTHDGLVEQFKASFDTAVGARLSGRSSPISSMLSSGFDSSSVTGTAARLLDDPDLLTAYTSAPFYDRLLKPTSRFPDEAEIAAKSAAMLGVRHRIIRNSSSILGSMRGLSAYFESPAPNPINLGWWRAILDEVRQSGQSVILTGSEGNFTLSYGGPLVLPSFLRSGRWLRWAQELRAVVRTHTHMRWRGALFFSFDGFMPLPAVRALEALFDRKQSASEFDFINPDFPDPAPPPPVRMTGDLMRDRLNLLSLHDNGERFKGMTALTGIEERDPTVDRRFVELCLSMRPEHLLQNGEPRPIARAAMADRLNPRVLDFHVRGIQGADWYSRLLQSEAREMLDQIRITRAADLLDVPKLEKAIDNWPPFDTTRYGALTAFGFNIWRAMNLGLFVAEMDERP